MHYALRRLLSSTPLNTPPALALRTLPAVALLVGAIGGAGCAPTPDAPTVQNDEDDAADDAPYAPPESFSVFVGDFGEYSWTVLFVKAPMDAVSNAYGELTGETVAQSVAVTATDESAYGPSGTVAQVQDSEWVQVCHRVGFWDDVDAAAFAETLDAPALLFQGEDTSGAVSLERYAPGEPTRTFLTADDRDLAQEHAESIGTTPPPADAEIVEDYDAALASLGVVPVRLMIGAPAAGQDYPDGTGGVIAPEAEAAKLERVDATPAPLN